MNFSILHPTRGRPQKSFETTSKWMERIGEGVTYELIVSVDDDDPKVNDYVMRYLDVPPMRGTLICNSSKSAVAAINHAARISRGDILIVVSDDTDCPQDWGKLILKEVEGKKDWILKTQDGIQRWIITMPVMDRTYYERFGYVYFPGYRHMFCDTELTCVADLLDRKLVSDLMFPHDHYSIKKADKDEVSVRADATWNDGQALFITRYKYQFGIENPVGSIFDPAFGRWIKKMTV